MKFNNLKFACLIFIIIQILNLIRSIFLKNKHITKSAQNYILNKHKNIKNFYNYYTISNKNQIGKPKINKIYPNFIQILKEKKFNNNIKIESDNKSKILYQIK